MQISAQISHFHGVGIPFEVCEMPVTATPNDVLVRVSLATICGSDLHTVSGRRGAETRVSSDMRLSERLQHRHTSLLQQEKNYGKGTGLRGA